MKKVFQTKFGEYGNCLEACIASLFEINIDEVPSLRMGTWQNDLNEWLIKKYGLWSITITAGKPIPITDSNIIAIGMSERGLKHAVIYCQGKLLHDPHPSNTGILEVDEFDLILKYF